MSTNDQLSQGTDLDKALSAFFKAEMPDPFPLLKLPAPAARLAMPMPAVPEAPSELAERFSTISKSRMSLTVSVALLLGGCWYLSSQIGQAPDRPSMGKGDGSAKIPKEIRKATDDRKSPTMP